MKSPKSIAATAMLLLAQQINGGDPALARQRAHRLMEARERMGKDVTKIESRDATTIVSSQGPSLTDAVKFVDSEELRCEVREQVRGARSQMPSVRRELKQSIEDAKIASREQARKLAEEAKAVARTARSRSEL